MSHEVLDKVMDMADELRAGAEESEKLGRLSDDVAKGLKQSGIIRLLQRKTYDGFEAHPREFAETVMGTASSYGSAESSVSTHGSWPSPTPGCRTKCSAAIRTPGRRRPTCPVVSRHPSRAVTG